MSLNIFIFIYLFIHSFYSLRYIDVGSLYVYSKQCLATITCIFICIYMHKLFSYFLYICTSITSCRNDKAATRDVTHISQTRSCLARIIFRLNRTVWTLALFFSLSTILKGFIVSYHLPLNKYTICVESLFPQLIIHQSRRG